MRGRTELPAAGGDGAAAPPERGDLVNALAHGLAILQLYTDDDQVVTVSEMARQIGVHRSNASRLAATLHAMGFLSRAQETGQYQLGPQLIRLGRLAARHNDLRERAIGPLRRLVARTGETGHIGVLDGGEALTTAVVDGWHSVRMHSYPNKRSPAYCSSIGKTLLAGLDDADVRRLLPGRRLKSMTPNSLTSPAALLRELARVRELGYAVDNEELEIGLRCVAAPIRDADGAVVASIGLSGPAVRLTPAAVRELSALVLQAAAEATAAIGGTPAPPTPGPRRHR